MHASIHPRARTHLSISTRSSTQRAMGPAVSFTACIPDRSSLKNGSVMPSSDTRQGVGLNPTRPLNWQGIRTEPPMSVPIPSTEPPTPISAPSPPLLPPAHRAGSHALSVVPKMLLCVSGSMSICGTFVLAKTTAPASCLWGVVACVFVFV